MGKSAPTPPEPPNYVSAANATAAGNLQYAEYTTSANRPTVDTPMGDETWTNSGTVSNPDYTENISLTPTEQAAETGQQQIQENQTNLGQTLQGQAASEMAGGFNAPSLSSYTDAVSPLNESFSGFNPTASGVGGVNTAAPQFSQATANAGTQAAFNAEMGLVQPEEQLQTQTTGNQLALEGLAPGSQAYNNAETQLGTEQNQENSTIANNAVATGNQEASMDYQNALEGYDAGNTAQDQAYGEAMNTYGTGQTAMSNEAALQSQENSEALQNYGTAYTAAENNYLEPLNAMQSVLGGEQVSEPSFPSFATQAQTAGPNTLGAAEDTSSYNQGIYNTQAQEASNGKGAMSSLAGAAAIAAFA
jgi:hypothetical protein